MIPLLQRKSYLEQVGTADMVVERRYTAVGCPVLGRLVAVLGKPTAWDRHFQS